ncbi:alpha/beta hydrolase [Nodularia sp. UHCC 0506]|uniref:alpha/beta fold hydrolase n=1 Tax=Nodularia sp. UHCC 0506 TaxID=3110243 RepID=UPI002B210587|nr:alpha/beta hydrolase [Nodularia sp. UHCC 0506]MEA5513084.1 alpha/beta hydrolase [Nodularia sp. UHCC 0506]
MKFWFKWIAIGFLFPVIILFLGLFLYEYWSRIYLAKKYPPPGQLVDVGDSDSKRLRQRKLHLHCEGEGDVTVVLEDGLGPIGSLGWGKVHPPVAQFTKVCAYDRAGIMWSDPSPHPPTADKIAQDLHTALNQAGINPPYVLVGLSMGGIYSRVFAQRYPDEVVGMILVDSAHPEQEERFPPAPVNLKPSPINLWLTRQLATMGILRLSHHLPNPNAKRIPPEMLPKLKAFFPQSVRAVQAEAKLFHENLHRVKGRKSLGDRPMIVLTAAKPVPLDKVPRGFTKEYLQKERGVWQELQAELSALSARSRHIISEESSHLMYFDQPELIIDAIHDVVNEVLRDHEL